MANSNSPVKEATEVYNLLITSKERSVLLWAFMHQHRNPKMRRNETHLQILDMISEIKMHTQGTRVLSIPHHLLPAIYSSLILMQKDGMQQLVRVKASLVTIQDTYANLCSLIDAIENLNLREVYGSN